MGVFAMLLLAVAVNRITAAPPRPNIVFLFGDDWAFGDMGANWDGVDAATADPKFPRPRFTPHMDALAASGMRLTDFHTAASVCTPSRAGLLTGRLGLRTGITHNFNPSSSKGLPIGEITVAEHLKTAGYRTAMVGKWHLGTTPGYSPTYRGFDQWLGLPYSDDMGCTDTSWPNYPKYEPVCARTAGIGGDAPVDVFSDEAKKLKWPLPLYHSTSVNCSGQTTGSCDGDIIEQPAELATLAKRYGEFAHAVIGQPSSAPFFLYMAFAHMHVPQFCAVEHCNATGAGPFADALAELDVTVGEVVASIDAASKTEETVVFMTGDNGPWEAKCELTGSKGPFRGAWQATQGGGGSAGKFTLFEGGHRVVGVISWPGRIKPGTISDRLGSTLDFFPTATALAGLSLPPDRKYDGLDLFGTTQHTTLFHPNSGASGIDGVLDAVRYLQYKAIYQTGGAPDCQKNKGNITSHNPPLLFDLSVDMAESAPLDPSNATVRGIIDKIGQLRKEKMHSILTTYHSIANYLTDAQDEPCCNRTNYRLGCRCSAEAPLKSDDDAASTAAGQIDVAHIVWMNHLDVGFTNNIASVLNIYWHEYFPKAIQTAREVNKAGEAPVFKYTTHAWLLDLFFNCPHKLGLQCEKEDAIEQSSDLRHSHQRVGSTPDYHPQCVVCPSSAEIKAVEAAIRADVITWHAFPFNAEPELADRHLLLDGIAAVHALDSKFGKSKKTVISQRDVPGVTRAIIPLMATQGLTAFSEGCNAQIQPPQTPGNIFNWRDTASNRSILMLLHPRGYGFETDDEYNLQAQEQQSSGRNGAPLVGDPCPTIHDVVTVPGYNQALVYAFKDDNQGPPAPLEVALVLSCIKHGQNKSDPLFPGSSPELIGSSYDAFVADLLAHPDNPAQNLPVVTSEIGDTWIYGAGADPKKTKLLRLMMRARAALLGDLPQAHFNADPHLSNFSRLLLKNTEHTFGLHGLGLSAIYSNVALDQALTAPPGNTTLGQNGEKLRQWVASWQEQRLYPSYAMAALNDTGEPSPLALALWQNISAELNAVYPVSAPDLTGWVQLTKAEYANITTAHFLATVSGTTGGISSLVPRVTDGHTSSAGSGSGGEFVEASDGYDLFQFVYRTANQSKDFTPFRNNFTGDWDSFPGTWFTKQPGSCYDKRGLDNTTCAAEMGCAQSKDWLPDAVDVWAHYKQPGSHIVASLTVELTMPQEAHVLYGSPEKVYVQLDFPTALREPDSSHEINAVVRWIGKRATRLPEASFLMLPFAPCLTSPLPSFPRDNGWELEKLGSWVRAADVVFGGAAHLHAVGDQGARRTCIGPHTEASVHAAALDSAVISVGRPTAFPTPLTPLTAAEAGSGVFAVLHNNYWDTNYPMWYPFVSEDANESFRFRVWFDTA